MWMLPEQDPLCTSESGPLANNAPLTVLGVGGAQEEQGRTLQVCLSSSPNTRSTHVFIHPCVSVTMNRCAAVPVPQIQEQIVDVIKVIPEEWMSKRIVQQIADVPVQQIPKQIVDLILGDCGSLAKARATARVGVPATPGAEC